MYAGIDHVTTQADLKSLASECGSTLFLRRGTIGPSLNSRGAGCQGIPITEANRDPSN